MVLSAVVAGAPSISAAAECGFQPAFNRPDEDGRQRVTVYRAAPVAAMGGARPLLFITNLKVNTDGTKISYHPQDPTGRRCASDPAAAPCAINNVQNAFRSPTRPISDFIAVRDADYPAGPTWSLLSDDIIERNARTDKPCLTPDGYLVSMTSDVAVTGGFGRLGDCDQSKWIDALAIPAIVLPKATAEIPSQFAQDGVRKRSMVVGLTGGASGRVVPGIVGDAGPADELGEASVAMNRKLNGLADSDQPRHRQDAIARFQAPKAAVLIFPGAAYVAPRPITPNGVQAVSSQALQAFGGADKLYRCIRTEIDPGF